MLRKLSVIGLLLSAFVFSLFIAKPLIAQTSFSDYHLEALTNDLMSVDALDDDDAALLTHILTEEDFLTAKPLANKDDTTYILYARPGGELGKQLHKFWQDVKAKGIKNPAVDDYPPHISLTGFFSGENNKKTEDKLIVALQKAISSKKGNIPIHIKGNSIIQKNEHKDNDKDMDDINLDYIPFQFSSVLHDVAVDFLHRAGADPKFIKPKKGSKIGYHLTLREKTFGKTTEKIRKLEKQDINLDASHLQQNTTWALYIYKKTNGNLKEIYKQTINAQ